MIKQAIMLETKSSFYAGRDITFLLLLLQKAIYLGLRYQEARLGHMSIECLPQV